MRVALPLLLLLSLLRPVHSAPPVPSETERERLEIERASKAELPNAGTTDGLGVNIHFTDARPGELKMLGEAGVRWVRMDFGWGGTERIRGQYDFSRYDRLLADLDNAHLRAILILDYGNTLYGNDRAVRGEEAVAAYSTWAAAAAKHFAGRGVLWELWNEPNGGFWKPKADVREYATMALAASKAIRAAAPGEQIIGPATSTIDFAFLEECFKAGLLEYWNAVSVHPYRQEGPEAAIPEYARLRRLIEKYAPANKRIPILSAEWGYSSVWKNFDEGKQAQMLARQWLTNMSQGIPISIWYDWHDDGTDAKEPEHHFGIVRHEYRQGQDPVYEPKPAFRAAQALTRELYGSLKYVKRIAAGGPDDYILLFEQDKKWWVLAAWTSGAAHNLALPTDPPTKLVDLLGQPLNPGASGETDLTQWRLPLTNSPLFAHFPITNQSLSRLPSRLACRVVLQPAGQQLQVQLEKLTEEAVSLNVVLQSHVAGKEPVELEKHTVSLPAKTWEAIVPFTMPEDTSVPLNLHITGRGELDLPVGGFHRVAPEVLTSAHVRPDGDAKVASEQTLVSAEAPEPPPGGTVPTMKLTYQAAPGWKFFQMEPAREQGQQPIPGTPHAFGMWIYGDGQGGTVRLRVKDSAGQTWQPSGKRIDWKGWRYVQMDLGADTAHWGGKADNAVHYPLHWESCFLLDKDREKEVRGEIYLTPPYVVE